MAATVFNFIWTPVEKLVDSSCELTAAAIQLQNPWLIGFVFAGIVLLSAFAIAAVVYNRGRRHERGKLDEEAMNESFLTTKSKYFFF